MSLFHLRPAALSHGLSAGPVRALPRRKRFSAQKPMTQSSYLEKYGTVAGAPWQEGKAPIIRFVTDDHKVIGVMFGHITRTYEDRVSQLFHGVELGRGDRDPRPWGQRVP